MPRSIIQRLSPECVEEFRVAAKERYYDALTLTTQGRRTAAIYLFGYAAEMIEKAAYFTLSGFSSSKNITHGDLRQAASLAKGYGLPWTDLHNVYAWSQLIVRHRISLGLSYSDPHFANQFVNRCQSISALWNVKLRYHKNRAYAYEVAKMKNAVEWLLHHSLKL